jgi:hypothetical protein
MVAGFSLFSLFFKARSEGVSAALQVVVQYYRDLTGALFGWAEAPLESFVESMIGQTTQFAPIWVDVAMLSGFYFLRNVVRLAFAGRIAAAGYQLICAIPIMLFTGAGAGMFYRETGMLSTWLMTLFPLVGIFLMSVSQGVWFALVPQDRPCRTWRDFGGSRSYFILMQTWYGLQVALVGTALSALYTILFYWSGLPEPPVLVLFTLIFSLAIYWLAIGTQAALGLPSQAMPPSSQGSLVQKLRGTSAVTLAAALLQTIFFFLSYLLVNAAAP